jgi:hypothetical protein
VLKINQNFSKQFRISVVLKFHAVTLIALVVVSGCESHRSVDVETGRIEISAGTLVPTETLEGRIRSIARNVASSKGCPNDYELYGLTSDSGETSFIGGANRLARASATVVCKNQRTPRRTVTGRPPLSGPV